MAANEVVITEDDPLNTIDEALAASRSLVDRATTWLAQRCERDGRIDADLLDERQVAAYELAIASSELLAAETLADYARRSPDDTVSQALVAIAAADAIQTIQSRLWPLRTEFGLEIDVANAALSDRAIRHCIEAGSTPGFRAAVGSSILAGSDEVALAPLDEDRRLAQEAFARFAREQVAPVAEHIHRADTDIPESLLQPLREMGCFGLSVPQCFGGSAPDDRDDNLMMVVITETLSRASLGAAGSLITRPEIMTRALLKAGTPAQQAEWLPKIAAGDPLCAIAITEPDYGSDVAALQCRATRTTGGWLIDGAKTWCTFAGKAGVLFLVARTEADKSLGYRGLSVFLVEKPSNEGHEFEVRQAGGGMMSGKAIPTIGYRGMHSFDISFRGFFVPDANLLGGKEGQGQGFYAVMAGLTGGRIQTAARACGVMQAALSSAAQYARDRRVFGAPLAALPLTQARIARMAAWLAACRQLTYRVAGELDDGHGQMEASLVKLLACRTAEWLTRDAMQMHGGMGYAEESAVSRYFVDARVLSIFEGAEETLAIKVVARELMQRALQSA
ncbi:MAG: acyl-CoA dehydrogenase family protein [Steroidobacteraceae bacterium]